MIPYYNSPKMLDYQFERWSEYPNDIAQQITVILVDDGSPDYPALDVVKSNTMSNFKDFQIYRIKTDILMNTIGARNLAASVAPKGWLISTDMDHVFPPDCMAKLLEAIPFMDQSCYYSIARMRLLPSGEYIDIKPHRDTFLLTKDLFWRTGGFDEDFVGWYGGSSIIFIKMLEKISVKRILENVYHVFISLDIVPDAHCSLKGQRKWKKRDYKRNRTLINRVTKMSGEYKPENPLRFDWERVA